MACCATHRHEVCQVTAAAQLLHHVDVALILQAETAQPLSVYSFHGDL